MNTEAKNQSGDCSPQWGIYSTLLLPGRGASSAIPSVAVNHSVRQSACSPLGTEASLGVALCPGNSQPLCRYSLTASPCQQSTACGLRLGFFSHQDWLSPTFPHSPSRCRVPIQGTGGLGFSSSHGVCISPGILSTGRPVPLQPGGGCGITR